MNQNLKINLLNSDWDSVLLHPRLSAQVPTKPGIYGIFTVKDRIAKIAHGLQVRYIGMARKSIRSRFLAHTSPTAEHNEELAKIYNKEHLEFWFMELPKELISQAERELIRAFKKNDQTELLNKINYKNGA